EFEIMDDNFTLNMQLAVDVCKEIMARGLGSKIKWSTPNGVRPEKMNEENLKLFKESGCKYLIFAPESGSQRLLKEVYNKFIDTNLILKNVKICHKIGIKTGCFIITGLYVETDEDYALTRDYVKQLAKAGLDEAVVFPMLPYPNTPLTKKYFANINPILLEQDSGANMNDLPSWYPEKEKANKRMARLYKTFYVYKSLYHPLSQLIMFKNILTNKQETKTERSAFALISRFLGITPKPTV
ncbi:radical SAM protein, partial [Candidatus Woesearchaeota archaeon]|nr:radical SAM protein [Candidatus Woesearchaeota archaeon]